MDSRLILVRYNCLHMSFIIAPTTMSVLHPQLFFPVYKLYIYVLLQEFQNYNETYRYTRVVWKVSDLAYNQQEIQAKRLLGWDPDRSWCHLHTSLKLFWSWPMAPWTSAACAAAQSMDPWAAIKKASQECWRWHQLLYASLPNGRLSQVSHQL